MIVTNSILHPGITIREEMDQTGLTITDVAHVAGVKRPNLSRLLSGRGMLTSIMAYRIDAAMMAMINITDARERHADRWIEQQAAFTRHAEETIRETIYADTMRQREAMCER